MNDNAQISVITNDSTVEITGVGALDLYSSDEFGSALKQAAITAENVVVDLRAATYIDTAIIADIAVAGNKMLGRGKRLRVLLSAGTHPLRVLETVGFSALVDMIVESTENQGQSI